MATTLYRLAEQCRMGLYGGGYVNKDSPTTLQELILACQQELANIVKISFYANKNEGFDEVSGNFIYTFKNIPVVLDEGLNLYYSEIPSTFIDLPHALGINMITYMKNQALPFVYYSPGQNGLFAGLTSESMSGRKKFWVENTKIFYNGIDITSAKPVLMKLAVALDSYDDEQDLNISPDVQSQVVQSVLKRYIPEAMTKKDNSVLNQ